MTLRTLKSALVAALVGLCVTACAVIPEAPVGPYSVGKRYQVTLVQPWNDISLIMNARPAKVRLLSLDGPLLNRLYLTDGLAPGDFMVKPASKERPTPVYRKAMSASERVEFVSDSVAALDYRNVETTALRPGKFGTHSALRFDLSAQTAEGLNMSGTALISEIDGKGYVLIFLAPSEHYYAAQRNEVENIFMSIQIER